MTMNCWPDEDQSFDPFRAEERREWRRFWLALLGGALGLLLSGALVVALAHQAPSGWTYPSECCSGHQDCAPIDDRLVREEADGWHVSVPKGAHPTRPWFEGRHIFKRGSTALKRSGDGRFHLCIGTEGQWRCLYVPPGVG